MIIDRVLVGRPGRFQISPNSCSFRNFAKPWSKFFRNSSAPFSACSPYKRARISLPLFSSSFAMVLFSPNWFVVLQLIERQNYFSNLRVTQHIGVSVRDFVER
ncbi:MAG TPA: hypothetical protein VEO55_09960, partial [Candidatus Dormibacteraeota bacterium]|nr:hypothetical protein [Candidatus Dormibacteraeota bacterium]